MKAALIVVAISAFGFLLSASAHKHHHHDPSSCGAHFAADDHAHHSHSHSPSCQHSHSHDHFHAHKGVDFKPKLPEELAEEEDLRRERLQQAAASGNDKQRLSTPELWFYAMGSSFLVSVASLVCLAVIPFIFPLISKGACSVGSLVDFLAAFGGGAMLGDTFLHQLPHAFSAGHHGHEHDESHAHSIEELSVGLSVLAGIILFFLVEKIVRYVEEHGHGTGHHQHHHHSHQKSKKLDGVAKKKDDTVTSESNETKKIEKKLDGVAKKKDDTATSESNETKKIEKLDGKRNVEAQAPRLLLGYLNLFSDGVHNFTDGMALGAAYLAHGRTGGWNTTCFLLLHELPQEAGDFGILVRSGFSVFKALSFNFLSALVALAGTALALVLGANPEHSALIEGFTAGGFLYITLAGVLPDMHQQEEGSSMKNTIRQLSGMLLGISIATAISLGETRSH